MKQMSTKDFAGLVLVVLLGELILCIRFSGNLADDFIALFLSFGAAFLFYFLTGRVLEFVQDKKWAKPITLAVLLPLIVVSGAWCVVQFSYYASSVMLGGASVMLPFLLLGGLGAFAAVKGERVLSKLAVVSAFLCLVLLVILTAVALRFVTPRYLVPHTAPTLGGMTTGALTNGLPLLSSVLSLAVLGKGVKKRGATAGFIGAVLASFATLAVTAGILTDELAATQSYPFTVAVSAASMGQIFSRLDGLLYSVGFFTCLMKTSACFLAAIILAREIISLINIWKN